MTTAQTHSEMQALGFDFERWQDVVEQAIATNQLTVTGEIRGGQLIQFNDASGAQLNILAVEPFSTYIGFDGITQAFAHVSMVNDVLSYLNIITPNGDTIAEITANLAQGPLLAEVEEQQWQQIGITAMGLAVKAYESAEAFESEEGSYPALFESDGAEVINSGNGAATPTPGARFAARVLESEWRHNQLSGKKFMHIVLDGAFPFDLCLPATFGELPAKDAVLAGTALMTANVLTPMSGGCGSGGGCSCGSGGCGGH
ncbi:hypothetical protein ACG98H_01340 [Corynebacterium sp. L4756]|uniref:hypothetical protein n=1 Tax=unclassified Corynebacterium TaxID=2624378 RepID=UPI00374CD073